MADSFIGYVSQARKALRSEKVTPGERAVASAMLAQAVAMYDVSAQLRVIIRILGADRQALEDAERPLLRLARDLDDYEHEDGP